MMMRQPPALPNPRRALCVAWLAMVLAACGQTESAHDPGSTENAGAAKNRWTATTGNGLYEIALGPRAGKPPIGAFHEWVIEVRDANGGPVHPAQVSFDGGMPAHGHGLPTAPQVTEHLGDGRYRLEGVRFNMAGSWTLIVGVDAAAGQDRAQFDLELGF